MFDINHNVAPRWERFLFPTDLLIFSPDTPGSMGLSRGSRGPPGAPDCIRNPICSCLSSLCGSSRYRDILLSMKSILPLSFCFLRFTFFTLSSYVFYKKMRKYQCKVCHPNTPNAPNIRITTMTTSRGINMQRSAFLFPSSKKT